jgi:hypothetical protein
MARLNICSVNNKNLITVDERVCHLTEERMTDFQNLNFVEVKEAVRQFVSSFFMVLQPILGPWRSKFCRNFTYKWVDHLNEGGTGMSLRRDQ